MGRVSVRYATKHDTALRQAIASSTGHRQIRALRRRPAGETEIIAAAPPATVVDARTTRYGEHDLAAVLEGVKSIHVVRGKKRTHIDVTKEAPDGADLAAVLLGPTGNLRAPTLKQGTIMLVGFSPEL